MQIINVKNYKRISSFCHQQLYSITLLSYFKNSKNQLLNSIQSKSIFPMKQQEEHISTRYTLVPITDPTHQAKLQTYMSLPKQPKTSFCRFYLRGICIMKPHLCKFAHSFEQLVIEEDDQQLIKNCNYNQKQRKKLYFQSKQDFQQKALFILKNVDYWVLYNYQFSDKWKNSSKFKMIHSLEEIKQDRNIRIKIRQVLHRQNWAKLISFLCQKYQGVDYPISFLSKWFSKVGFEKPQTRSKFSDFMRYMTATQGFRQVNILMPPRVEKTVFVVNCNEQATKTYLYQNIQQLQALHHQAKQQYKKQQLVKLQPLPWQMRKRFICRYFMAGNCQYTQQECNYAHSIEHLKYEIGQKFEVIHRQVVKGREQRLNYISLHRYCVEKVDKKITLEELNDNSTLRALHRRDMHLWLYSSFMKQLTIRTGNDRFKLGFIQKQYNSAGFNHSQQNKFGQFQSALWDIGYTVQQLRLQGQQGKSTYVYKIPPIQQLDVYYRQQVNTILEEQAKIIIDKMTVTKKMKNILSKTEVNKEDQIEQNFENKIGQLTRQQSEQIKQVILQSAFRKKLYRNQQPFTIPLHIYLRLKSSSLQQIIKQFTINKSLLQHIFFQTNQQNYKKLIDLCKSYFKGKKDYVHKVQSIEFEIKTTHKDQINLNHYVNLRNFLNAAIIDSGKRIYFLAFGNNSLVIDKGNMMLHEKNVIKAKYQLKTHQKSQQLLEKIKTNKFRQSRIVIVDSDEALTYAEMFLSNCNKLGVDLEGRLKKDGYIDLIQVSAIFNNYKQIFVFDIFLAKTLQSPFLYCRMQTLLKHLFEDASRVKILHDCKQDASALKYLMGIELHNVFDTSGMNIVLEQKEIYEQWNKKDQTIHHILRKVFEIKTPGLNSVLEKWGAPNGVNIFKQSMKKRFHQDGPRIYFQQRPIDPQFLQYSAQDVEDLIDIYQVMKKADTEKLSQIIGQIYASFHLSNNNNQ